MSLRDRLDRLRRQSGADVAPGAGGEEPPAETTRDRVERLRRQLEALRARGAVAGAATGGGALATVARPRAPDPCPALPPRRARPADPARLAELLGGEILAPGVILSERRIPLEARHGAIPLRRVAEPARGLPEGEVDPRAVVFLDTETSGLAGGTGTVAFLLGLARLSEDALVVRQYMLTGFVGEAAMFASAAEWIDGVEGVVTYNGRAFDIPLLAARCRLAGVRDAFSRLAHVDLLGPTRRAFGRRWEDCRLATAERRLLRFERENDLPGWLAPESWLAFLRHGDASRLPLVAEHNHRDVVSLAALVPVLAEAHRSPGAWDADVLAVARALERRGEPEGARRILAEHEAMLDREGLLELARLHRRARDYRRALPIWERLAAEGVKEAVESLAKFHEHVRRDYATALALAEQLPPLPDHDRRRERLRRRLGRGGAGSLS